MKDFIDSFGNFWNMYVRTYERTVTVLMHALIFLIRYCTVHMYVWYPFLYFFGKQPTCRGNLTKINLMYYYNIFNNTWVSIDILCSLLLLLLFALSRIFSRDICECYNKSKNCDWYNMWGGGGLPLIHNNWCNDSSSRVPKITSSLE